MSNLLITSGIVDGSSSCGAFGGGRGVSWPWIIGGWVGRWQSVGLAMVCAGIPYSAVGLIVPLYSKFVYPLSFLFPGSTLTIHLSFFCLVFGHHPSKATIILSSTSEPSKDKKTNHPSPHLTIVPSSLPLFTLG